MKRSEIKRQLLFKLESIKQDAEMLKDHINTTSVALLKVNSDMVRDMNSDVLTVLQYLTLLNIEVENDEKA